jgi:hypothetical protein
MEVAGTGGCIAVSSAAIAPGITVRRCIQTNRGLSIQLSEGTRGVAGGLLRLLSVNAAPFGACRRRTRPLLLSDLRPNGKVMMRAQTMIYQQGRSEGAAVEMLFSRASQNRWHGDLACRE